MLWLWLACAAPEPPAAQVLPDGLKITSEAGIERVEIQDGAGVPLARRRLEAPVPELTVPLRWPAAGRYAAIVRIDGRDTTIPLDLDALAPVAVTVDAPVGQGALAVADGASVPLTLVGGAPAQAAITAAALQPGEVSVAVGDSVEARQLQPGERLVRLETVSQPTPVAVTAGGQVLRFTLEPRVVSLDEARAQLRLTAVTFPAHPDGSADIARPAGRLTLPSPAWRRLLQRAGLGFRSGTGESPWAWWGVSLENRGSEPYNVVIRARVLDEAGRPDPAFRPQMRAGDDGSGAVSALLRVPPGQTAAAALPLYVDEAALSAVAVGDRRWERVIEVLPLGSGAALETAAAPLYVSRGSAAASAGIALAAISSLGGFALLFARGRAWLGTPRTGDLMTIALFGSLSFLVGAASQLLGFGLATLLGPFSILLTGLFDDGLRYALLATLITLLPRPGTAALATLVAWLISGIALGAFSPTDTLFVGSRILWLEGALWLSGLTRDPGWRAEPPLRRWLRLAAAFGSASALGSAAGIALHIVFYRLFFAPWYAALLILGPGSLYVLLACALAVPFAASLQRIQR